MAAKTRTKANNKSNRHSYESYRNFNAHYNGSGSRSNTSSAYQLNPGIAENDRYFPGKSKPRTRVRRKLRRKTEFIFLKSVYAKIPKEAYLMMTVLFCGSLLILMLGASVTEKKIAVVGLQSKLKTIQEANRALSVEISESYDEKEIERIATEVLGMSKPKPYQYFHINVPENDRVIQYNTSEREAKTQETFFQRVLNLLRKE